MNVNLTREAEKDVYDLAAEMGVPPETVIARAVRALGMMRQVLWTPAPGMRDQAARGDTGAPQ